MKHINDGLVGCKYGHRHRDQFTASQCEVLTFRALCKLHGVDFEAESKRRLNTLPTPPRSRANRSVPGVHQAGTMVA